MAHIYTNRFLAIQRLEIIARSNRDSLTEICWNWVELLPAQHWPPYMINIWTIAMGHSHSTILGRFIEHHFTVLVRLPKWDHCTSSKSSSITQFCWFVSTHPVCFYARCAIIFRHEVWWKWHWGMTISSTHLSLSLSSLSLSLSPSPSRRFGMSKTSYVDLPCLVDAQPRCVKRAT